MQETQTIFRHIPKEDFETDMKESVERMEVYLAASERYFKKENVKCMALKSEDDVSELICIFVHFYMLLFHSLFKVEFDIDHFVLGKHRER